MNLINWFFRKEWIECPRCLGKGHVDLGDIERLHRLLYWLPGKCAYCKGRGRVSPDMPESVQPDLAYLSLDTPFWERWRLIRGDQEAFNRAREHEMLLKQFISYIRKLYMEGIKDPEDIVRHLFKEYGKNSYSSKDLQQMIQYIQRVIKNTVGH